ncbi:membrane protein [Ruminococcus albus SY3]|uniref:Membrane protein n=1 Tax=Ruminococcus albus SY3 TaxID=1341156 RepID=A0A011VWR9_RUMAL|nr:ECF transporter S component [Ruminococcus albus]EXM39701.1 membrane protein [Ruminococcus albus SY3]
MKKTLNIKVIIILGILFAWEIVFAVTPIGTIPIGPLSITLQTIPVAIAAAVLGPVGGAIIGGGFGLLSYLQCIGFGIPSGMGVALNQIDPGLCFIQRFIPRLLVGLLAGVIFDFTKKKSNHYVACAVTGFCTALMNTVFFMSSLILLFGNSDYVKNLRAEKAPGANVLVFICVFVGINAVAEMIATPLVTSAVGTALYKARLISPRNKASAAKA